MRRGCELHGRKGCPNEEGIRAVNDKEEARRRRQEAHKKMIERLDSYDSGPRDHDAEEAERERLLLYPPPTFLLGDSGDGDGE